MRIGKISVQNIRRKPLTAFLSVLLMAFGSGIIILLLDGSKQIESQLLKDVRGIDMVVGAKGSPLQLILSGIYHIDDPTGNISLDEFNKLASHPMVELAIPLAYGDNYAGYRIVGTTKDYAGHYQASLASGKWWSQTGEVVLGATAAKNLSIDLGDHFLGSHGLGESIDEHEDFEYQVIGIMEPTGSAIDKLILTAISSVWAVHDEHQHGNENVEEYAHDEEHHQGETNMVGHNHEHDENYHHHHDEHESENKAGAHGQKEHGDKEEKPDAEITVGLISFRNAMGNIMLPRMVNEKTNMQAALPSIEINRLFSLLGSGVQVIRALALLIVVISAISVFISLFQSLKDRRYELVLLRVMGASNLQLLWIVLLEGLLIAFMGYLAGMVLGKLGLMAILSVISSSYQYSLEFTWFSNSTLLMLPATLGLGIAAALIPALMAYRLNISKELSNA